VDPDTKLIWTLSTEDFRNTAADILKDPEFGNIFKEKSDLSSVAGPYVEALLICSFNHQY
jgi:hypothetical protein